MTNGDDVLGEDIRQLRKARAYTLKQLAERAGLSFGFLSKVERGASRPSLGSLQDIAEALDVEVGWFTDEDTAPASPDGSGRRYIVRSTERRQLTYSAMAGTEYLGFEDHLLSASLDGQLALGISRYAPGGDTGDDMQIHEGEEAGVVIEGTILLTIDEESFVLETGDSFSFPGSLPHRYQNKSGRDVRIVWANTPISLRRK